MFPCSHVPMERFYDGTRSRKFENTRRKGTDQENSKKTRRKEWRKEKEEIFLTTILDKDFFSYPNKFHLS